MTDAETDGSAGVVVEPFAPVVPEPVDRQPDVGAQTVPAPVTATADALMLTCIRLGCREQGLATTATRCPRCDHPTQLLANHRWPRGLRYDVPSASPPGSPVISDGDVEEL